MFKTSAVVAITDEKCVGCQRCVSVCPSDALAMSGRLAVLDEPRCVGCFKCVEACYPYNAISITASPNPTTLTIPEDDYEQPSVDDLCAKARYAPDAMVCLCTGTTAAEIAAAIVDGVHVPEDLALATGVRAKCGMWCLQALCACSTHTAYRWSAPRRTTASIPTAAAPTSASGRFRTRSPTSTPNTGSRKTWPPWKTERS